MIAPGARIGNYQLHKELGAGGMGVVWIAEQLGLDRQVAIKVLDKSFADKPSAVSRFFTEARAANRIRHEHIVEVTDSGQAPSGEHYYVMELLQGQTLGACIKKDGVLSLGRILHIALQVADALAASHAADIIHRDLKPDNIFLISRHGDVDYVKVLDFGVAKLIGDRDEGAHLTRTGAALGTPLYMSPEQAMGKKGVDHRTDIYALGVILFEMATGTRPHDGDSATEVIMKHLTLPFPTMRSRMPEVSLAFQQIQMKAIARDVGDRWASMQELRASLLELARRESVSVSISGGTGRLFIGAMPDGPASRTGETASPAPVPTPATTLSLASGERGVTLPPKKGRSLVPVVGGLVLAAALAGGVVLLRSGPREPAGTAPRAATVAPAIPAVANPPTPPASPAPSAGGDAGAAVAAAPEAPPVAQADAGAPAAADAGAAAAAAAAPEVVPAAPQAAPALPATTVARPSRNRPHVRKHPATRPPAAAARPTAPAPAATPPAAAPAAPKAPDGKVPLRFRVKGG